MKNKKIIIPIIIAVVMLIAILLILFWPRKDKGDEYCDVSYHNDVYMTEEWDIKSQNDNMTELVAVPTKSPKEGEYLITQNELGIKAARKIKSVEEVGDKTYKYTLEPITDLSEVMDDITFSGTADFGVYGVQNKQNQTASIDSIFSDMSEVEAANENKFSKKTEPVDLKIGLSYSKNSDGDADLKTNVSINDESIDVYRKDLSEDGLAPATDKELAEKSSTNKECTISGDITLEDLTIFADGTVDCKKIEKTKANVKVYSNEVMNLNVEGKIDGQLTLASIPVPIPVTGGIVTIVLEPYLYFEADGSVAIGYRINNTELVASMDVSNGGVDFSKSKKGEATDPTIVANVSLEGGVGFSSDLQILTFSIIKPYINVGAIVDAEVQPIVKGWSGVPPCVEISFSFPVVSIGCDFLDNPDSFFVKYLKKITGWDFNIEVKIVDAENAPIHKTLHIETNPDTKKLDVVDSCTHQEREEPTPTYGKITGSYSVDGYAKIRLEESDGKITISWDPSIQSTLQQYDPIRSGREVMPYSNISSPVVCSANGMHYGKNGVSKLLSGVLQKDNSSLVELKRDLENVKEDESSPYLIIDFVDGKIVGLWEVKQD